MNIDGQNQNHCLRWTLDPRPLAAFRWPLASGPWPLTLSNRAQRPRGLCALRVHSRFYGQAERAISNGQLNALLRLHIRPIDVVVFHGPSYLTVGRSHLEEGFALICFQRLSRPDFATQLYHWRDNWITRGLFIPVLSY